MVLETGMRRVGTGVLLVVLMSASSGLAEESWARNTAASYLDQRAELWTTRSRVRQKLPTACISCHTAMPYLLSRTALDPGSMPEPARVLFADVEERVANWSSARVWYDESRGAEKPDQSRGTESVLNALVLTTRDRRAGKPLTAEAKTALGHMWAQQKEDGHWSWIHFGLGPWETDGSDYWGASLAAVASRTGGSGPPERVARLKSYLRAGLDREMSLHNRLSLLWAASGWPELLSGAERARLVKTVLEKQRPDGGFRLIDLGPWPSKDGSSPSEVSDGYATAFTVFVLEQLDEPEGAEPVARGLAWLRQNQKPDGRWETLSPNKDRSKEEDFTRLLASDAATAFAVLALTSKPGAAATLAPP